MRSALLLALALVLLPTLAAFAGDEPTTWFFKKGDATMEVTVTGMDAEDRVALEKRYLAEGWARRDQAASEAPGASEDTLKDIQDLLRSAGRLPKGFVPHSQRESAEAPGAAGMEALFQRMLRPVGKMILEYLDARSDPVKGPVYEGFLREVGGTLAKAGEPGSDMLSMGAKLLPRFLAGLADPDPAKAAVHQEIMELLMEGMGEGMGEAPTPPVSPHSDRIVVTKRPAELGGAPITTRVEGEDLVVEVTSVPEGSPAAAAGLLAGDRILSIDGKPTSPDTLAGALGRFGKPGKLSLTIRRKDGGIEVFEIEFVKDEGR